jgi:23S rRNA (guanosine2251-2'-O)-methyltransferase
VAGRRPVEEAFVARRPAIRLLVVPQRRAALEKLVLHATNLRIPIVEVEGGSLTALAGFDGHQGVALVVEPRQFASLEDVLARAAEREEPPFILVLDSLEDPHNVGTLLRSAEAAGVHGVLFPTHRQAPLSPSAVKASAGAIEHLLLCPVDDLPGALSDLHARGVRVAGAEGDAPMTARQSDLRGPLAIVVGSEGQGLGPAVRRRCDLFMRIPMKGAVGSLNAAVAGSILLFEALAQRDPNATPQVAPQVAEGAYDAGSPMPAGTDETATPQGKRRAARKSKAVAEAEPASGATATAADDAEPPSAEIAKPARPKPRRSKAGAAEPPTAEPPTAEPPAAEPPAAEPAPKRRVRKGLSTEPADASMDAPFAPPETALGPPEDELLPGDIRSKQPPDLP